MSGSDFSERLLPDTYSDDEPVHIFTTTTEPLVDAWVPEQVWSRLVAIGYGYRLHLLPLVGSSSEAVILNSVQAGALIEEMAFVSDAIPTDEALQRTIAQAVRVALAASRSGSALGVEGP